MEKEIMPLETQASSMATFTSVFQELRRETMGQVLETISNDVSRYFLTLHPGEGFDDIQLKFLPEDDGVEFHIYYKGEEITPPRKFLSESYLNGLGVCLFLATMRTFNKENAFVILDDIVNSFDAEHRADLARLLVTELSDHQLIVLTHDSVWFDVFRRLARSGWQYKRITHWTYEEGIEIEVSQAESLTDCNAALGMGRVEVAAPRVRTYIENRLKTLLKKVGGRVRFREGSANDERSSGELLYELKSYLDEGGFFDFADKTSFDELEASTFITNYGSHDRFFQDRDIVDMHGMVPRPVLCQRPGIAGLEVRLERDYWYCNDSFHCHGRETPDPYFFQFFPVCGFCPGTDGDDPGLWIRDHSKRP